MTQRLISLLAASALTVSGGLANACAFHTYLPERTLVDRLLETENVVLARPAPDDPFRFVAVEALEGTIEQADLPTLVDSSTRRRLALNPEDSVLFARDGGPYGPFVRLADIGPSNRELLETIMDRKEDWIMGDDHGRFQLFANLLEHPDRGIRDLALRELDRAPYAILHSLDLAPRSEDILPNLWKLSEIPLVPIRILLLGLSEDEAARHEIRSGLTRARFRGSTLYLGPLATALIEIDGTAGVDQLDAMFLADRSQPQDRLELVVEAMAIHAGAAEINGDAEMRAHILDSLARFAESRPDRSDTVARQFMNRYDFGMAEALQETLESGRIKSAKVVLPVSSYVMIARQGQMQVQDATPAME